MSRKLRLEIEYDGTAYSGWQRQDNGPTIQGHLEAALADLLDHPVQVFGASRTDAGVHALGQVAHFETTHPSIPAHGVLKALNSTLPRDIAIVTAEQAPADFHARFDSRGKHYRYRVLTRRQRSALDANRVWHLGYDVDVDAVRAGATPLCGEHDFSAFRAAGCSAHTTTRRIDAIEVSRVGHELIFDVRGNAFLRNMVRILVGTLIEVGAGKRAPESMVELLASRDRTLAGRTAPAAGLTLMSVSYPNRDAPDLPPPSISQP